MDWKPDELEALYANVYARRMECPACGSALELTTSSEIGTAGVVGCGACAAQHLVAFSNDPLRSTFRDYTDDEKRRLLAADRSGKPAVCPVDGTIMDVHLQRSLGRTSNVVIRCRRCTRAVEYARTCG